MDKWVQFPSIKTLPIPYMSHSITEASTDEHDETSFIEMDPRLPPSKRFIHLTFDLVFDFPLSSQFDDDKLASSDDYLVLPIYPENKKTIDILKSEEPSTEKPVVNLMARIHCVILKRLQRIMLKRLLMKYFAFLLRRRPVYQGKNSASAFTSPRSSSADCDSEISIYEAVLHCKRNHGN